MVLTSPYDLRPGRAGIPDERRHHRVPVALLGRYMLPDRREYPCRASDMSPGGVLLACAVPGEVGERVVIYLEQIGRIEGSIARLLPDGFAVAIKATAHKREKLASQLTWLANRMSLDLPEDRRYERLVPKRTAVALRTQDGQEVPARILDVSLSGMALGCNADLPLDAAVRIGRTPCTVVRHFKGGFAVAFLLPLSPDRFDETIVF